jgi:Ser/Thr protein kinase RdoA (MazF antagonist)
MDGWRQGMMHCDCFLDNVLLHADSGTLSALLDWEDAAQGW